MSYKKIIGVSLLSLVILYIIADTFAGWYRLVGWWALFVAPATIAVLVAFWALIYWLIAD